MVERGLTIKGLAITYIIRRAKGKSNVDNTEQRARWFGYKRDYLDICRVYTTSQIKKDFHDIYEHDEALWDTIQKNLDAGKSFKDIPRIFMNNSNILRLTRPNVAKEERMGYVQIRQQDSFVLDEQIEKENLILLERIKEKNKDKCSEKNFGSNKHLFIENLNYKYLYEIAIKDFKFPINCNLTNKFFEGLLEIFNRSKLSPLIDVVFIRCNNYDIGYRSIDVNGKIESGLMIGHNNSYVGDRKIPDYKPDSMQIQVHMIRPKNINISYFSPCIAFYVPPKLSEEISKYVKRLGD